MSGELTIIGRAERIDLLDFDITKVPAKVDTGADSSSIWASNISVKPDGLHFVFFGEGHKAFTGEEVVFKHFTLTRVANSFGTKQLRYKIKLRIRVQGRSVRATFTLSDRSTKTYPILLGRRLLRGKFIVDVAKGTPLTIIEGQKAAKLARKLIKRNKEKQV